MNRTLGRLLNFALIIISLSLFAQPTRTQADLTAAAIDVPRISGITINGDGSDWKDQGLMIDYLTPSEFKVRPREPFNAKLRLAWDSRGLLLLAHIVDTTHFESANINALYTGDAFEIFLSDGGRYSKDMYQVIVGPGLDRRHPLLRVKIYDNRTKKPTPTIAAYFARRATSDGYVLEGLLPWSAFGITPTLGVKLGINLYVDDSGTDISGRHRSWYPSTDSWEDFSAYKTIVLAPQAGKPDDATAAFDYSNFRDLQVTFTAPGSQAGNTATLYEGSRRVASAMLLKSGDDATGVALLPLFTKFSNPLLRISVGALSGTGQPPDTTNLSKDAVQNSRFDFTHYVFDGPIFPTADYAEPLLIEDLAGQYTVKTTYYDRNFKRVEQATEPGRYGAVSEIHCANGMTRTVNRTLFHVAKDADWEGPQFDASLSLPPQFGIDPKVMADQHAEVKAMLQWTVSEAEDNQADMAALMAALSETSVGDPKVGTVGAWQKEDDWWYEFGRAHGTPLYRCVVHLPQGYNADPTKKWPFIVFLHGHGGNFGTWSAFQHNFDTTVLQPMKLNDEDKFIVVAPELSLNEWWSPLGVKDIVEELSAKYRVNPDQIYLTGLSMGGYGTWATAIAYPDIFAAVAPMAGLGDIESLDRIKNLPIWVFHGDADPVVSYPEDKKTTEALEALGGRVRFTVYPGVAHDSWVKGYNTKELYEWMLAQKRGVPAQPPYAATNPTP